MNPTETQFTGNLPTVPSDVPSPITVIVPSTGKYLVAAHIVTTDNTIKFEVYGTFPIAQSSNYLDTTTNGKRITLTYYTALTAGPQSVAFILQNNPAAAAISVDYIIQLVRIG